MTAAAAANANNDFDWITPDEARHLLRIGEPQIYAAIKHGQIPAIKIGGQWRIYRQHLEQLSAETFQRSLILQTKIKATQEKMAQLARRADQAIRDLDTIALNLTDDYIDTLNH